jgi:hypothetical protein
VIDNSDKKDKEKRNREVSKTVGSQQHSSDKWTKSQSPRTRFISQSPTPNPFPTRKTPQKPPKRLQSVFNPVLFSVPNPKIPVFHPMR